MANIDNILTQVEQQTSKLAQTLLAKFEAQGVADAKDFVESTKGDLANWTNALEAGELDKDDFESLVRGETDLAEMRSLKEAGLAQITIDTFTNGVVQILINTALAAIKV
jgi:hypothetical protein